MRLVKGKQAKLLAVFLLLSASAVGQPGRTFKYRFNDDLKKRDLIVTPETLVINYSISDLNIESITNENGTFYRISIPGHSPTSNTGQPELPVLSRLIEVPDNYSAAIKITGVKSEKIKPSAENFRGLLYPTQEGETKITQKEKPVFKLDKATYAARGLIASDTVNIEPVGTMRNRKLANLIISPVRYNPKSNIIEVITSMKIEITFDRKGNLPSSETIESPIFSQSLAKGLLNYDSENLIPGYTDKPVEMIILTDTSFLKHLDPFLKWKKQRGFNLTVLSRGAALAGTTYSELKASITDVYNDMSQDGTPPEYLLIIGDVNKIPYYGTGNITDMYYGEFDGNGDYIPEMLIGRIPASDTTQLKSVIKKIIQYEKYEFDNIYDFQSNALVTAGYDNNYSTIMNGQVRYAVDNYMTTANRIKESHFYHPSSLSAKDTIIKIINKGTSFINYTGHGDASGWLHLNIKVADTVLMKNKNMYPFIISNACKTSQFNLSSSFGNNMLLTRNKGAIGFIGCSNDSYWDEDLYWAAGNGTTAIDPTYATTGLGFYDRLFHTHNEPASEWYVSMGQINYAGNLAVSASTSSRKKYYWETYNLVGDPSILPIIGKPETFNINIPDTLPNSIKSLTITIDPFSYIAVSHWDTLWDASFASPSGSVTLNMPGLSNDSCLVVVTGQNKIPVIKTVYFSALTSQFLNLTSVEVNDKTANNDGKADYGETISLSFTLGNLGLTDAKNVYVKLSSESDFVRINTDSLYIGSINAESDTTLSNGFNITVSDAVPDNGIVTFNLVVKNSISEKHYPIDINVHSPKLLIVSCKIDDSQTGNANFIADPGEVVNLIFEISNIGSSNTSGDLNLYSDDGDLTILQSNIISGILQFGKTTQLIVPVRFSEDASIGKVVTIMSSLDCSPYTIDKIFSFRIGMIRESFESSSFKIFPWINMSPVPWITTGANSYEGNTSARSGIIGHNSSTSLMIKTVFSEPDSIKFYYKVSSEANFDYVSFRLNGKELFRKSGEISWEKKVFSVQAGLNIMEWIYKKDNSVSNGADAAWIDLIDFSVSASVRYIKKDLESVKIVSPVQSDDFGREHVSVKVFNSGADTLKGFYLAYSVNDNMMAVKQHFNNKLIPFMDTVTVTFAAPADLSKYGVYNFCIFGYDNDDDYLFNDTLRIKLENTRIDEPLLVFPNPFTNQLKIVINSNVNDVVLMTLVNHSGIKIYSNEKNISTGENIIILDRDIARIPPGVYYLNLTGNSINKSIPVIKMGQ